MAKRRTAETQEQAELEHLASKLRDARDYLGFSQEEVAVKLGVPRASISAMEHGKRKVSSLELKQLARLYRRPVEYFFDDSEPSEPDDETTRALFRATRQLSDSDRAQVLTFAKFLEHAGSAPTPPQDERD